VTILGGNADCSILEIAMDKLPFQIEMNAPVGAADYISIRGTRLEFAELVDPRLFDVRHREDLRQQLRIAQPFEHLVVDGWFSVKLLKLVREEFDLYPFHDERNVQQKYEKTIRSPRNPVLGPASGLYFSLVNSGWFANLLSFITGVDELIVDHTLRNGGLHESRAGGKFNIHRDFERNACTGLKNEMVLLTYLNEDWNPEWNGGLELWDAKREKCVRKVEPEMGRSILMRNGPVHFHGHPVPMTIPEGKVRRSLATYYYVNEKHWKWHRGQTTSLYLSPEGFDKVKQWAKRVTPPVVWDTLKRVLMLK
jgi:hypothetical protein